MVEGWCRSEHREQTVDGGVGDANIHDVAAAGATVVVAGSAVYNPERSVSENLRSLRAAAEARSERVV